MGPSPIQEIHPAAAGLNNKKTPVKLGEPNCDTRSKAREGPT